MERLTKYNKERAVWLLDDYGDDDSDVLGDAIDKLADYENAEEQGLLLRLPCKVGDTVFAEELGFVISEPISKFEILGEALCCYGNHYRYLGVYGRSVFLTREEAEKALADMGV